MLFDGIGYTIHGIGITPVLDLLIEYASTDAQPETAVQEVMDADEGG